MLSNNDADKDFKNFPYVLGLFRRVRLGSYRYITGYSMVI